MSSLPGATTPAAGFDQPFELLGACHDNVRRMLTLLQRLAAHLRAHGADAQAAQAARDVMRYFDVAAPAHHEDEELHVFPALLAADPMRWRATIERLRSDHTRMSLAWPAARAALQAVIDGRHEPEMVRAWQAFAALYDEHVVIEDEQVFPAARSATDAVALTAMGAEMAARRGAPMPPPRA